MFVRGRKCFLSTSKAKSFDKILIANRGEIACRVMKTAKKLGIKTVAVYSEADVNSLHVKMADEAYCIGPPASTESYLNIKEIMKVAKASGAKAVHPGYGFLSENYKFCEELERAGIEFIGPAYNSIHMMGDKIESKRIAKEAGVNIIPGYEGGVVPDPETAVKVSREIGYPVMIKASAGGGGKGMRIAWNDKEVVENFKIAADESRRSFGDDRLLIEKFIEQPRHIEIQLIGDKHGNIIYLPERECSIQRRNQKVVEEAPSVLVDEELRRRMGEQAVQLAKKVGYFSAGTVEFLVDVHKNFYFLEMNTRLQIEHPITEYITGLDLVELMIRVAEGHPLGIKQDDVKIKGWAIECRVYAEDPKLYLPSIGRLKKYIEPEKADGMVRCDTGIIEGAEISIYYDPLICKLSTFGGNRNEALARMRTALDTYVIKGVNHNIPLLREVISNPKFIDGSKISTKFLKEEFPEGFSGHKLSSEEEQALLITAMNVHAKKYRAEGLPKFYVKIGEEGSFKAIERTQEDYLIDGITVGNCKISWNGSNALIEYSKTDDKISNRFIELVEKNDLGFDLRLSGSVYAVTVLSPLEHDYFKYMKPAEKEDLSKYLLSPMSGQILELSVKEGQIVQPGAPLLTLEAMKMQNVLRSQRAAKITKLHVSEGQKVGAEDSLMEFEFI